jgi:hypothetical protein
MTRRHKIVKAATMAIAATMYTVLSEPVLYQFEFDKEISMAYVPTRPLFIALMRSIRLSLHVAIHPEPFLVNHPLSTTPPFRALTRDTSGHVSWS